MSALYPEALASDLRDLRQRQEERAHLEALRDGLLDAPGGVIRHRGRVIQRRALVSVLAQVTDETEAVRRRVEEHDRLCRTSHRAAARTLGRGWEDFLCGLSRLHHYAAHLEANLEDARGHLANVYAIVTADGRVTAAERQRLVMASTEVHSALWEIFEQRMLVELPPVVMRRLNELMGLDKDETPPTTWADALPKNFSLPPPSPENIGDFLGVLDSWVDGALGAIGTLERVSLELLVEAEAHVQQAFWGQTEAGVSPEPPEVPKRYPTLVRGQERSRQKRLGWWDRFQTADGFLPSAARFVVAGTILGGVLAFGGNIGHPTLTVLNGLALPVVVEVQGEKLTLGPMEHRSVALGQATQGLVSARSSGGETIESFRVNLEGSQRYVYNVAGATSLIEWTAVYGRGGSVPERELGAPRWFASSADYLFEEPPKSLKTKSGGDTKVIVSALPDAAPSRILALAKPHERSALLEAHALWDAPGTRFLPRWLSEASQAANAVELIERRLLRYPDDISALRLEQDVASPSSKPALCQSARSKSSAEPQNLDFLYLALRCEDDETKSAQAVLDAYRAHPQHPYLANMAGAELRRRRDYVGASAAFTTAAGAAPLADAANLELARLARIAGEASPTRLKALAQKSTSLTALLALESGEDAEGPERAFSLLAQGELERAVAVARPEHDILQLVLPLAAASDGASQALVDEGLEVLESVTEPSALWVAIALSEREQRSHAALDARALKLGPQAAEMLRFADAKFLKGEPSAVLQALWRLPGKDQPVACVMALVRVNVSAPDPCQEFAKAALFAPERPYFR